MKLGSPFLTIVAIAARLDQIPTCALSCAINSLDSTGCDSTDIKCICEADVSLANLARCLIGPCSSSDQAATIWAFEALCREYGVTIGAPQPTQALSAQTESMQAELQPTERPEGTGELSCSHTCLLNSIQKTGCSLTDFQCSCGNTDGITSAFLACSRTCSTVDDDELGAVEALKGSCQDVGVMTVVPQPTEVLPTETKPTSAELQPTEGADASSYVAEEVIEMSAVPVPSGSHYMLPNGYMAAPNDAEVQDETFTITLTETLTRTSTHLLDPLDTSKKATSTASYSTSTTRNTTRSSTGVPSSSTMTTIGPMSTTFAAGAITSTVPVAVGGVIWLAALVL